MTPLALPSSNSVSRLKNTKLKLGSIVDQGLSFNPVHLDLKDLSYEDVTLSPAQLSNQLYGHREEVLHAATSNPSNLPSLYPNDFVAHSVPYSVTSISGLKTRELVLAVSLYTTSATSSGGVSVSQPGVRAKGTSPEGKPAPRAGGLGAGAVELSTAGGASVAKVECSKPVNEVGL